ncbi:KilA-N domain-containing protein [Pseudomonas sp. KU26590]|uniref:KilA-N domain-containing protein n=1 Tax=Pseudomonas sp. KU26590 TaxID=2991051 RepID=UPI00223D03AF|nr:KilA-N domain-containing protein [Pseudomonas sp. KU26590]UZJ58948.1 KilA-N domain-containing protein [Pseudomonas sp. KU26590]
MKARKILTHEYADRLISFDFEGWMNASNAGECFCKDPREWLGLDLTQQYINGLARKKDVSLGDLAMTRRGTEKVSGLWLHPKLAGKFARWLSIDFEIWFEDQMEVMLSKDVAGMEAARRHASMSYRSLCEALVINHQVIGKETKPHHYMNEARLINEILTGLFRGRNRSQLTVAELELITLLENRDVLLLGQGKDYLDRKIGLTQYYAQLCDAGTQLHAQRL